VRRASRGSGPLLAPSLSLFVAVAVCVQAPSPAAGQEGPEAADTFLDPVAGSLFRTARAAWRSVDASVVRYSARIQQRIAAAIRTPLKDRVIYRSETAVRAFWDRDYEAIVQVLGARTEYPGRSRAVEEGDLGWLEDLPFDEPFQPGGDRLFFGLGDAGEEPLEESEDDFWIAHPLGEGADTLYRYQSGDTLQLFLPDGRRLQAVELDVLPREADVHRITGTLWIEPESGALVRGVYRLSREFDALRDLPELREQEEDGDFRFVPGLFKPWTFNLKTVAVDYSLWNFEVWLPRSMRLEGEAAAGILKLPVSMEVSYRIESVTTESDLARAEAGEEADAPEDEDLVERHFESRGEALAFIARLLSDEEGGAYEVASEEEAVTRERESYIIVPEERSGVETSPHLPPPIWEEAPGFPSEEEIEAYVGTLAELPAPAVEGLPWSFEWGWARPDLLRYNRIEGPALGGRFRGEVGGSYAFGATGFFGFADLEPKGRLELERATVRRRLKLGVYRELTPTDPEGRYLLLGNSANAFLLGRDDGEYYRATGADFTWRPPDGSRESFRVRAYVERQESVSRELDFALSHAFDDAWQFRPNVLADEGDEAGAEVRLAPWWGGDPAGTQVGLELYGQVARWWPEEGGEPASTYGRTRALVRAAFPLAGPRWRLALEAEAGTTWGDATVQRSWFLGSSRTLRGYAASTLGGPSFTRGRVELARRYDLGSVSVFSDVGWAGRRREFEAADLYYGVGAGVSLLDGLVRFDLSHGLTGPEKEFRIDLYLDGLL